MFCLAAMFAGTAAAATDSNDASLGVIRGRIVDSQNPALR